MIEPISKKQSGYTLVEVLVYTALLTVLMVGVLSFALSMTGIYIKEKSMEEVMYGARHIERVLGFYLKEQTDNVLSPLANQTATSTTLSLIDNSQAEVFVANGRLMLKLGQEAAEVLTSSEIEVSNLLIRNYNSGKGIESVNISCTLAFKNTESMEYSYEQELNMTINTKL